MVLNTLINVKLNAVFAKDTTIAILDFLRDNWPALGAHANGSLVKDNIRFDTAFRAKDKLRLVVIEAGNIPMKFQGTGGTRYRVTENKRVQIWCNGHSAENERWCLEQQIFSMINANIQGCAADGIEEMFITEFQKFNANSNDQTLNTGIARDTLIARSFANVTLCYDMARA